MDSYQIPFILRDAFLCLGMLIGIGGGVFLLIRKKTAPGILAMAGFVLFSLEPIADFIILQLLYRQDGSEDFYIALDWTYSCVAGAGVFLGVLALVVAFVLAARPQPPAASWQDTPAMTDLNQ